MKFFKDITQDNLSSEVDVRDPDALTNPEIEEFHDGLKDIFTQRSEDIDVQPEYSISVSKKRGKFFDALEKGRGLFSKRLKKTLDVRDRESFSLAPYWLPVKRYIRSLGVFGTMIWILVFLVCVLFFGWLDKLFVENRVNAGYEKLIEIRDEELSLPDIQKNINDARFDLLLADVAFTPFKIIPRDEVQSVRHVISGGRHLTRGLDDALGLYETTTDFIGQKPVNKIYFSQLFLNIQDDIESIESSLTKSLENYREIEWLPNPDMQEQLTNVTDNLEELLDYVKLINHDSQSFLDILGYETKKRYLVVFQNADEIRPTGGFMGSMGLAEVFRGRLQLFQTKDVYAIEWDLKKAEYDRLAPPKGIDQLTDTFGLRDANYYANLNDSSQAIKFFTDKSGIEIDGIIYLNQNILLHLLDITGPVYFEKLNMDITSDNFSHIMSLMVESKAFKEGTLGTPKQVLFDFMTVFAQKLESQGTYYEYLQSLIQDVDNRDIMMWSFHPDENQFLTNIGANGRVQYGKTFDYSYPVYTSISGNKSDRYMYHKYRHEVTTQNSCDFLVKSTIESTHNMTKNDREQIDALIAKYNLDSPDLIEIQGAGANKQFVRVILPAGAQITPQDGLESVPYGSRSGAEFFIETLPQETSFYSFEYFLPNPECYPYTYQLYKQPGIPRYDVTISIDGQPYSYPGRTGDFYFEKREE